MFFKVAKLHFNSIRLSVSPSAMFSGKRNMNAAILDSCLIFLDEYSENCLLVCSSGNIKNFNFLEETFLLLLKI